MGTILALDFSIADNSWYLGDDMERNRNVEICSKQAARMVRCYVYPEHSRNTSNHLLDLFSEEKEKIKIFKDKFFSGKHE
jgi:hypothetical protein